MANSINTMCIVHILYICTYVCTYNHPLTSKGKSAMCHSQAYEDTLLDRDSAPVYIGDYVGNVAHGQGRTHSKRQGVSVRKLSILDKNGLEIQVPDLGLPRCLYVMCRYVVLHVLYFCM